MGLRRGTKIRTKIYNRFRGVDFTTDSSLVDDSRSPWAPNIIADEGGMPEKRVGWRVLEEFEGAINGIHSGVFAGERHYLVHTGEKIYRWYDDGETPPVLKRSNIGGGKSTSVYLNGNLWIFTGSQLIYYDGTNVNSAKTNAYVPLTIIGRTPSGGGETYEAINLLSDRQTIGILADGTSTVYQLPYSRPNLMGVIEVKVDGVVVNNYTVSLNDGTVTFDSAPAAPLAGSEDNVFITFRVTADHSGRINGCTVATVWGVGGATDRIVCSGNPSYPNRDWISDYMDGLYWPDLNYSVVGLDKTAIVGYRRMGESLAIVKEDNGQDSTVFIRTGSIGEDGEPAFSVKPALSGVGAVSRFGFGNINDDQLILTARGVFELTTNNLTAERIAQPRSRFIDPRLIKEPLSEAICVNWDNCFLIFVSGRVYGLDGRQAKAYSSKNDTDYSYESFYWTNIPASAVMKVIFSQSEGDSLQDELYFGTSDGKLCKFNTDVDGLAKYSDDGEPIEAVWSTKADDDGDVMVYKTLLKRGNSVTLKPYARSSARVCFKTEKDVVEWQAYDTLDIFEWEDLDFERFTFNSNDGPAEVLFNCKIKNYKRLQIFVKNDALNEGFGVFAITKHYTTGKFTRR